MHKLFTYLPTNIKNKRSNKSFKLDSHCAIISSRNFEHVFLQSGGYIYEERYIQRIRY